MNKKIRLIDAAKDVMKEDPKTRDNKYLWMYIAKTLRKMGFKIFIVFDPKMPSPDAMLTERRTILNKKNEFARDFIPDPYTTYEKPTQ